MNRSVNSVRLLKIVETSRKLAEKASGSGVRVSSFKNIPTDCIKTLRQCDEIYTGLLFLPLDTVTRRA